GPGTEWRLALPAAAQSARRRPTDRRTNGGHRFGRDPSAAAHHRRRAALDESPAMSHRLLAAIGVLLVVAGILSMGSFFIVHQTEQALVLQLGEVRREVREPGLKLKWPLIENVVEYDKRVLDFEPPHEEVIVADQKRLVTDTYTRYRITNPLLFYQTVGTEEGVRARLSALV